MSVPDGVPDFSGKCISCDMLNEDTCLDLCEPRFESQGGRLFLVGVIPAGCTSSDWAEGCTAAIAWDRVTSYIVLDSAGEYQRRITISKEHREEK